MKIGPMLSLVHWVFLVITEIITFKGQPHLTQPFSTKSKVPLYPVLRILDLYLCICTYLKFLTTSWPSLFDPPPPKDVVRFNWKQYLLESRISPYVKNYSINRTMLFLLVWIILWYTLTVHNRTVYWAKNKYMFRISITWFIFNLQTREYIFFKTNNMVSTYMKLFAWVVLLKVKKTFLLEFWLFVRSCGFPPLPVPRSESTALFLVSLLNPHCPPFPHSCPHKWTLMATDDINMPESSSIGHSSLKIPSC